MEILVKLFGSEAKVKLMRLFLFNPGTSYSATEIMQRSQVKRQDMKKELSKLMNIGIIKKKSVVREIRQKKKKKVIIKRVSDTGYYLDQKFAYLQALKNLLIMVSLHANDGLVKKFASVGRIKLFIASGVFIQEWDTRVDLLVVGDDLNMSRLDTVMKSIEAEIGKEIIYSAFETSDFEYRYGMQDKLIRDILDLPHTTLVDKLNVEDNRVI